MANQKPRNAWADRLKFSLEIFFGRFLFWNNSLVQFEHFLPLFFSRFLLFSFFPLRKNSISASLSKCRVSGSVGVWSFWFPSVGIYFEECCNLQFTLKEHQACSRHYMWSCYRSFIKDFLFEVSVQLTATNSYIGPIFAVSFVIDSAKSGNNGSSWTLFLDTVTRMKSSS